MILSGIWQLLENESLQLHLIQTVVSSNLSHLKLSFLPFVPAPCYPNVWIICSVVSIARTPESWHRGSCVTILYSALCFWHLHIETKAYRPTTTIRRSNLCNGALNVHQLLKFPLRQLWWWWACHNFNRMGRERWNRVKLPLTCTRLLQNNKFFPVLVCYCSLCRLTCVNFFCANVAETSLQQMWEEEEHHHISSNNIQTMKICEIRLYGPWTICGRIIHIIATCNPSPTSNLHC